MKVNKIIVFGDSITYGKWDTEGGWVTRLRNYIDNKFNVGKGGSLLVYNLGIPGEVSVRMVKRVEHELRFRITSNEEKVLVIFAVGVNDSCPNNWMTNTQTPLNDFRDALRTMINIAKRNNCEIFILGLAPVNIERPTKRGLRFSNVEVKKYDQAISEVCKELTVRKIDIFDDLMKSSYISSLIDIVHPNTDGHKTIFDKVKAVLDSEIW